MGRETVNGKQNNRKSDGLLPKQRQRERQREKEIERQRDSEWIARICHSSHITTNTHTYTHASPFWGFASLPPAAIITQLDSEQTHRTRTSTHTPTHRDTGGCCRFLAQMSCRPKPRQRDRHRRWRLFACACATGSPSSW